MWKKKFVRGILAEKDNATYRKLYNRGTDYCMVYNTYKMFTI